MNEQHVYVFNQYYIDLLKKIKNYAKQQKDNSKEARDILRAIKKNYANMDKLSDSYIQVLKNVAFWQAYDALEKPWSSSDTLPSVQLYEDIKMEQITKVFTDKYTLHHYLMIFSLFQHNDMSVDSVMAVLKHMMTPEYTEKLESITQEDIKKKLIKLKELHSLRTTNVLEDELKGLESTSLGKLAKEIMEDINVQELQQSLQSGNMDILGSLQNPDSGFGKLVSSVSTKMISKLASGEIQQDKLLEDAMSLATKLPGMIPGMNTGDMGGMGNFGKILEQFQKMGMNPSKMSGAQKGNAQSRMRHAARKNKMSERLREKIQKKANEKNNNKNDVVEDHE